MSTVGDAFSGATSGVTDTTMSDASLGSDITGGGSLADTGSSLFGGSGGGGFTSFSDIANALSGGGSTSPTAAQSFAMTPPSAAAASGGDPTGAASGTQSATSPGSSSATQQGGGGGGGSQPNQSQGQHAPPEAVDQLRDLLKRLQGKPTGPTGLMQSAAQIPGALAGALPAAARIPPGAASAPMPLPSLTPGETGAPNLATVDPGYGGIGSDVNASEPTQLSGQGPTDGAPKTDASGQPVTAAGTPAADTPTPPPRPSTTGGAPTPKTDDQGRQITVQKAGAGAPPAQAQPQPQPPPSAALPTRVPHPAALPTKKPGAAPPPAQNYPATTQIQRDIAGISTGNPTALADLAHAAMALAPLIGMFMGGGGGRRGHRGGFQGMRGFRPFGARGGFGHHYGGARPWPYHHPIHGWDMHHMHPGGGWLPMSPQDGASFGLNPQQDPNQDPNALDPNRPPKETGADPGPANDTASGAIPGVTGKQVDDYTRQAASKWGIDPNIASKILGQESSYGQAKRPGDNGTSFGPFQLHFAPDGRAMGDDFVRDTGKDPRDPSTWKDQIDYAMKRAAMGGWGPWTTTMKKLGLSQWSGITTNPKFAGQPRTNQQPSWASNPPAWMSAGIPPELPVSSQPKVAGQ